MCACLRSLEPVGGSNVQLCPRARWALGREGGRPRVRAGAAVASFTKVSKTSEVARLGVVPGPAPCHTVIINTARLQRTRRMATAAEEPGAQHGVPTQLSDWLRTSHASEIIRQFYTWDVRRAGQLSPVELGRALASLGMRPIPVVEVALSVASALRNEPSQTLMKSDTQVTLLDFIDLKERLSSTDAGPTLERAHKAESCMRAKVLRPLLGAFWKLPARPHCSLALIDPADRGAAAASAGDVPPPDGVRRKADAARPFAEQCQALQAGMTGVATRTVASLAQALDATRQANLRLELAIASAPRDAAKHRATKHELKSYMDGLSSADTAPRLHACMHTYVHTCAHTCAHACMQVSPLPSRRD